MNEWGIVGVLVVLLGLLATTLKIFITPMTRLEIAITQLTERLNSILESIDRHDSSIEGIVKTQQQHGVDIERLKSTVFHKVRDGY